MASIWHRTGYTRPTRTVTYLAIDLDTKEFMPNLVDTGPSRSDQVLSSPIIRPAAHGSREMEGPAGFLDFTRGIDRMEKRSRFRYARFVPCF